jgi:hypothetical protein
VQKKKVRTLGLKRFFEHDVDEGSGRLTERGTEDWDKKRGRESIIPQYEKDQKSCAENGYVQVQLFEKEKQEGMGQLLNRKARKLSSMPRCYINATLFLLNPALPNTCR